MPFETRADPALLVGAVKAGLALKSDTKPVTDSECTRKAQEAQ